MSSTLRRFIAAPVAAVSLWLGLATAAAQTYIDVEAERERAGAVTTYGVDGAPSAAQQEGAAAPSRGASVGGLFNQVQQLQQEVMRLNGVVEELSYELRQLREQSLERYLDIDRRLAAGAAAGESTGAAATTAAPSAGGSAGTSAGAAGAVQEQPGEAEAYRAAYALVRGQEFDAAVDAFDRFLRRFPDGRYAPNAHYWLGELYLVLDPPDPELARQSFMLLLDQYPQHAKVPDALYKLGRVHYIKGSNARAREFLDRVMREYPDSSAARLAGDFLDQNL